MLKSQLFVGQHITNTKDFCKIAEDVHPQNVAENSSLQNMEGSRLIFSSATVINRMILVAEIVVKDHPWVSMNSCPTFNRATDLNMVSIFLLFYRLDLPLLSLYPGPK